ncbi:hypothetical protein FQP34_06770 [Peribacillus simplex]|uniref:Uncharacterized protein n=1 Tax=Peribacillus simplex TaxID=1478 RepID=A0A8B5Y3I4_9BACI|nr:hypothetical protein FQP34_06770 [Peribacillus simplex]
MLSSPSDIEVRCNGTSLWIDEEPATVHIRGSLEERSEVEEHKEVTKHSPPLHNPRKQNGIIKKLFATTESCLY